MIEDHWVKDNSSVPDYVSYRVNPKLSAPIPAERQQGKVDENDAPCVCVNRSRSQGTPHRRMHDIQGVYEESFMPGGRNHDSKKPNGGWTYGEGKNAALQAHSTVFKDSAGDKDCLKAQLNGFYGIDNDRPLNEPDNRPLGVNESRPKRNWVLN